MSSLPSLENNGKSWENCCHILQLSVAGSLSDLASKQFWQFSPSRNHRGALDCSVMQKTGSVLSARLRRCIKKIPVPLVTMFWLDKITVCWQVSVGLGVLSKLDFLAMFPPNPKAIPDSQLCYRCWHPPETSDTFPVISGVKQGFIISPFLFSVSYAAMP